MFIFYFYFCTLRRPCLQTCAYVYCDRYILHIYLRMFPFALFLPLPQYTPYTSATCSIQETFLRRTKWREIVTVRFLLHHISQKWQKARKHGEGTSREFSLFIWNRFFLDERLFLSMKIRKSVTVGSGNGFQMRTANTNCILPHIFNKQRFIWTDWMYYC